MKIEFNPKVKVTSEEKHITDCFCEMCEDFGEMLNDCYSECDDIYLMMEENICLNWDDFMTAVSRFTSFIRSCEED